MAKRFSRARGYARRAYYMGSGIARKKFSVKKGGFGLSLSTPFLAGMAIGALTDLDNNIPAELKVGVACAPVRGPVVGPIKGLAQGMLLGDLIQHYTGFSAVRTNTGTASGMWSNTQ